MAKRSSLHANVKRARRIPKDQQPVNETTTDFHDPEEPESPTLFGDDLFDGLLDDGDSSEPTEIKRSDVYPFVMHEEEEDSEYVLIECPGATLYREGTDEAIAGVEFVDDDDPLLGYRILNKPVHPPTHRRWRRIKKEAIGKIRRCQACQDYTVRMRRKEGVDFFIPSNKYPGRTRLKSISHRSGPSD
jgi:hypothetical protein